MPVKYLGGEIRQPVDQKGWDFWKLYSGGCGNATQVLFGDFKCCSPGLCISIISLKNQLLISRLFVIKCKKEMQCGVILCVVLPLT